MPRTAEIIIDSLTPGVQYKAEIYQDGKDAHVDTTIGAEALVKKHLKLPRA